MKETTCYKTSDGKMFEVKMKAILHEKKIKFEQNKHNILSPILAEFESDEYDHDYAHFSYNDIEEILYNDVDISALIETIKGLK